MVYKVLKGKKVIYTAKTLSACDRFLHKRKDFLEDSRSFSIVKVTRTKGYYEEHKRLNGKLFKRDSTHNLKHNANTEAKSNGEHSRY